MIDTIALVTASAPPFIDAGKSVADLWSSAGGIIADAEKAGKVDADATLRLKVLVDAQLAASAMQTKRGRVDGGELFHPP